MSFSVRSGGALAALAIAGAGIAGCGDTVIDNTKMADTIQRNLEAEGAKVTSVDCPSGVKVDAGATFQCTVRLEGGKVQIATLKIRNKDADVSLVGLKTSDSK